MLKLLVDTCVWLDLAKDHRQRTLLSALEELLEEREIMLVLPQIVLDEFARNKIRVLEESGRSLSSVIKRVKEAVDQFGDVASKAVVLNQLNDIDHRIATRGEATNESTARIEALFATAMPLAATDEVKLRAADRALEKRAPFHRQRNGIDDAILIETYAAIIAAASDPTDRFAFVTHNTKDFSDTATDNRQPIQTSLLPFRPTDRATRLLSPK